MQTRPQQSSQTPYFVETITSGMQTRRVLPPTLDMAGLYILETLHVWPRLTPGKPAAFIDEVGIGVVVRAFAWMEWQLLTKWNAEKNWREQNKPSSISKVFWWTVLMVVFFPAIKRSFFFVIVGTPNLIFKLMLFFWLAALRSLNLNLMGHLFFQELKGGTKSLLPPSILKILDSTKFGTNFLAKSKKRGYEIKCSHTIPSFFCLVFIFYAYKSLVLPPGTTFDSTSPTWHRWVRDTHPKPIQGVKVLNLLQDPNISGFGTFHPKKSADFFQIFRENQLSQDLRQNQSERCPASLHVSISSLRFEGTNQGPPASAHHPWDFLAPAPSRCPVLMETSPWYLPCCTIKSQNITLWAIWVLPPKYHEMIISCRKTYGCWVPAF